MKYQNILCDSIKNLRKRFGLTQAQFGEMINLTIEAVRNIEQQKSTPTAKTIDRICQAFKITPFDLLIPESKPNEQELISVICKKLKTCNLSQLKFIKGVIDLMK